MIVGVFSFLLSVLFIPGLSGAATTPRWALAAVMLPLLLRPVKLTTAHLCGLVFIWYAAISVTWSHPYDGLNGLFQLVVAAEAFWLGSQLKDLKPVAIGFGLGMWVSSAVMLCGIPVPSSTEHAGLFSNSNVMGEIAALSLVAALSCRLWWLIPGILPALWLAHSRGAFAALACVGLAWVWGRSRVWAVFGALAGLGALVYLSHGSSATDRMNMWSAVLPHLTILGHGLGSLYTLLPLYMPGVDSLNIRTDHLHNDWLEYVFETGAGSIFLFAVVILSRSFIVGAFAVEALFGFPMHTATTVVLGSIAAGYTVRNRPALRDVWAAWRGILLVWEDGRPIPVRI